MNRILDNVTLGVSSIPCFLCHKEIELRRDKNQKPYFICDSCGMQVFIRRKAGISLLNKLQTDIQTTVFQSLEVIALSNQTIELNRKLKKLENQKGIFDFLENNSELDAAINLIRHEIQLINQKIEKLKTSQKGN